MELQSLQAIVIDALEDIKAQDIRVYDTVPLTSLFDRVIIVSGTSNRQTRALANHVREKVKDKGGDVISVEGEETGEWVLVDLGDIVVHVMQPAIRSYYNLEELWGQYPLELKAKARSGGKMSARFAEVTAADQAEAEAGATPGRKAARKSPGKAAGEKAAAAKKPAKRSNDDAAGDAKPASKRPAAKRSPTAGRKSALGAEPPRKPAAKKSTVWNAAGAPAPMPSGRPTTRGAKSATGTTSKAPARTAAKPALSRAPARKPAAKPGAKPAAKKLSSR